MEYPAFSDGMLVDAALLNAAQAANNVSSQSEALGFFTPGLINPSALAYTFNSTLNVTITAGASFQVFNSSGVIGMANGTTSDSSSNAYVLNFASAVPGTGSITAYVLASLIQIGQSPVPVIGPPIGHPDYNP